MVKVFPVATRARSVIFNVTIAILAQKGPEAF